MKTDDLIAVLSTDAGRVDTAWLSRTTGLVALLALVATAVAVLMTLGGRAHLGSALATPPVLAKLALGAAVSASALLAYERSLRPGRSAAGALWLALVPVVVIAVWAVLVLAQQPVQDWSPSIFGRSWRACLIAVTLYALLPLAALVALANRGAPVDLRLTGMAAGLASAGLATMAYSLHCPEDALPFVASWYPLGMAISTALGAALLPKLTRW